jgi:hypothetical protein
VVLDNHSGASFVSLLKSKSDTSAHVRQVIAFIEKQAAVKVKALRFDRGGEYVNTEFKTWCDDQGIVLEPTAPCSPQQNGKAERLNRTLNDKARVMLVASGLDPKQHWGAAVLYANWLRNRSPYAPTGCTPFEGFRGKKPDISKAHVFGSRVVYKVPEQRQGFKFEATGLPGRFLGHDGGGFLILKEGGGTIVSRDVTFLEQADLVGDPTDTTCGVVPGISGSTTAQQSPATEPQHFEQLTSGSSDEGCVEAHAPTHVRLPIQRVVAFAPDTAGSATGDSPAVAVPSAPVERRVSSRVRTPASVYNSGEWVTSGDASVQANAATSYSFRI